MACKTWTMTVNNWTNEDLDKVREYGTEKCTRMVCGRETGESGTPHLQCAFTVKRATTMGKIKEMFPRAHIERAYSKGEAPFQYCMKQDEEPIVIDNREQGARKDLVALYSKLRAGAEMEDVFAEGEPSYQHICIAEKYLKYRKNPRPLYAKREVHWLWGPTGTGKSKAAYELDPTRHTVEPTDHRAILWFDGYTSQKTLLIEELRPEQITFAKLLKLTDGYTCREQTKGGMVWAAYERVIITSPLAPHEWPTDGTGIEQLLRRIVTVKKFTEVA